MDYTVHGILQARILEWVAFSSPGDLPNPGIKPSLPHCRWIPYQLSHKGSPKILEWVDYPFSRGSSQPRKQSKVLALQEDSLPTELWGKPRQSVRLGLISTDPFDFRSSEDVCISFHSWRIFMQCWVHSWLCFSFKLAKYCTTSIYSPLFHRRNPLSFKLFLFFFPSIGNVSFLSGCFPNF